MSCSFETLVGESCGSDKRSRNSSATVVLFKSCSKDIKNHKRSLKFSGIDTEIELILARCGIFEKPVHLEEMTICPNHISKLGIGWRRKIKLCCVPQVL